MILTLQGMTVADAELLYQEVDRSRSDMTNLVWAADATVMSVIDYVIAMHHSKDRLWGIFVDGVPRGCVTLRVEDDHDEIGYWIGTSFRGMGLTTRAVALALQQTPKNLVKARILPNNEASRKILTRNGFVKSHEDDKWHHYILER